jgi:hypothetical protein
MDDYKLPTIINYCRAHRIIYGLSSPYRYRTYIRYRTIYAKGKIHRKHGIYTITVLIDNVFEKALRSNRVVSLCRRLPINMIDKCCTFQDADEIGF